MAAGSELSLASLTQKHSVILRKGRAEGPRVLKGTSGACPGSLRCAGAALDHLKRVHRPEMGHAPSHRLPPTVLFRWTLHLFRAPFPEVVPEGEVHVGWGGRTTRAAHRPAMDSYRFLAVRLPSDSSSLR